MTDTSTSEIATGRFDAALQEAIKTANKALDDITKGLDEGALQQLESPLNQLQTSLDAIGTASRVDDGTFKAVADAPAKAAPKKKAAK